MMKFLYLLVFLLSTLTLHSQILTFDFNGLSGNEASENSNFNNPSIFISTITRGAGVNPANNGNRFNGNGWEFGTLSNAVTNDHYMEFTITPNVGCDFTVTSITVNVQASGTGPSNMALRSSMDSYTSNLGTTASVPSTSTFSFSHTNITVAVTYRIYMYGATDSAGSGGFEGSGNDIIVNGTTNCSSTTITTGTINGGPFSTDCSNGTNASGDVDFTSVGTFNAPNIYNVELSDATGSFTSPTIIGALTSTANAGNIPFNLPSTLITSSNYKIRIVGTDPVTTSSESAPFTITQNNPCSITPGAISGSPFTVNCLTNTTASGTINFTSTGTINPGNTYSVEMSDENGLFGLPQVVGTLISIANSGTINITISADEPTSSNYVFRIVSSDPGMTSVNSSTFTITQMQACVPTLPSSSGLIINEFSNGPGGNQEYYEFVVSGKCGDLVDIRGFILDDNNGTFTTPSDYASESSGIAPGHFRFSNDAQWANIPVGSLIVIYNKEDPNPLLPADDPTDANNDSLYVVPHNNSLFERCTTMPTSFSPDSIYSPCSYSTAPLTGWKPLSIRNGGDAIQVRSPNGDYFHGISYGGSEISGGPHNLKLFTGSGSGKVGWFNDGDFYDIVNWSSGNVAGNETPGVANNASNLAWLRLMRDPLSTDCPVAVLPVELKNFSGEFDSFDANDLTWTTLSERNASHFIIERSIDGKTWTVVNVQNAIGNTITESSYFFSDRDFINNKINYYRLNQTDFNGVNTILRTYVAIDNTNPEAKRLIRRTNTLGQEVRENEKGIQILIYEDGTIERIFKN